MGNFDDLSMAVASFGGNNKVIYDDLEKPSIMVGIPKMKFSDLITGGTQDTLDVFKVDGVEREILYISKYQNVVVNDRAYSLPMKDPKVYINFDSALAACRKKGAGWGLTPNGLWGALMLWCNRNNHLPRGNTNWDRSYEKGYEKGVNTYVDGSHGGGSFSVSDDEERHISTGFFLGLHGAGLAAGRCGLALYRLPGYAAADRTAGFSHLLFSSGGGL